MRILPALSLLVALIMAAASCSVQKRRYQPGFTFARNGHVHKPATDHIQPGKEHKGNAHMTVTADVKATPDQGEEYDMASVSNVLQLKRRKAIAFTHSADSCDVFVYRDGTELRIKVIDVSPNQTRYRRCDNPDGPVYVVENNKLFMIKYADGKRQLFEATSQQTSPQQTASHPEKKGSSKPVVKRNHPMAILSLICGILGFVIPILAVVALVLGILAIKEIDAAPETYRGRKMAVAGKVLGIIVVLAWLFILMLAFLSGVI